MLELNLMTCPNEKYHLKLDIVVGGDSMEDCIDSVVEYIQDHFEDIVKKV